MKNLEIKNKIAVIKDAIINDRLVVFAGSGISVDSGLPTWDGLLHGIKQNLNEETREKDALKLAQLLYNEKGEKEYYDIIKEIIFKDSTSSYNYLHEIIFKLNPQHVITTNYDNFFEQIIENEGLGFSTVVKDNDLPYAKFRNLLIKYHGDFENHNIVLKENDYLEFSKNHTLKEIFVKSLFSNKIILFVGYSFSDINLKILSREIQYILKKHHQRTYLIDLSENLSETEKLYYEKLGINIINYNQANIEIKNLQQYSDENKTNLSGKSKKVYTLLNYLKQFDIYKHKNNFGNNLTYKQTINELYNSLIRFKYFRVLPKTTIMNMFPINKGNKNSQITSNLNGYIFTCFNEDLYNLIKEYEGFHDINFSEYEREKINYCLNKFLFSNIHKIGKPKESPDSFCFFALDSDTKINLSDKIKKENACDCINCNIKDLNFSNALQKLESYTITDSTDLNDDLSFAYGYFQLVDFYNAYKAFKQIVIKANRLKKLEVSFLAKFNMYRIGKKSHLIYRVTSDNKDVDYLVEEAENIDLDLELNKTKYFVDIEVFEFLKSIKNGIYIQNLCDEVDRKYNSINKTKNLIKEGGHSSNSHIHNLRSIYDNLKEFMDYNYIIGNGYSMISSAYQKSINSFIVGYSIKFLACENTNIPDFGKPYLVKFDSALIKMIIEDSNSLELLKSINDNQLKNIEIYESEINMVVNVINNFLTSAYVENNFWGHQISKNNNFIGKMTIDHNFSDLIEEKLNNIFIIITYFYFPPNLLNGILQKIVLFIKHVKFPYKSFDYKYLKHLLFEKENEIEEQILLDLLEIYDTYKVYDQNYIQILTALKSKNNNFTTDNFDINHFDLNKHTDDYYIIYEALKGSNKILLHNQLHSYLINKRNLFHNYSYFIAIEKNIFDNKSDVAKLYIQDMKNKLTIRSNDNDFPLMFDYEILNFFYLIYIKKIQKISINRVKISNPYYIFLSKPTEYPESEFKVEWLKRDSSDIFLREFKKVPYILSSLEKHLKNNYDSELAEIYFKLK
ncbi:hypothetical protein CMU02_16850 [Elizabethkingia anophelis]|uniref:SIR2 family protein n=1 Tax=Elizabethkingia anophelis TaxID=1117645 RepID=UPI00293CE820|nr:hypothetical protein [Elizabethkingia anophelis]MDV3906457.1 hypothetical protein [Elizabethkingia anophelis]